MSSQVAGGTLYLVATPIGNLQDASPRAAQVLREADIVLAEDTRVSRTLLAHLGIDRPLRPYHAHNEHRATAQVVQELADGRSVAVISDAGTPGIADAAFLLVREAIRRGVTVVPVPGACAAVCALVASGLPCERFVFENFLPNKSGRRQRVFAELATQTRTVIVYESPHRIVQALQDLAVVMPEVLAVVARELTKVHEEFRRGTPASLVEHFTAHPPRGEIVLLFNPRITTASPVGDAAVAEEPPTDA
jgi:16S rRNA (cytidine1402-2'-O)-methyltransferase